MQCLQRPQEGVRAPGTEVKVEVSCSWVLRIESGLLEEQSLFSNPEPSLHSLSTDIFKAVCDCFFHSASKEHTLGALNLRTSSSARRCLWVPLLHPSSPTPAANTCFSPISYTADRSADWRKPDPVVLPTHSKQCGHRLPLYFLGSDCAQGRCVITHWPHCLCPSKGSGVNRPSWTQKT